ncbi:MAG: hypothetical protein GYA57_10080 [Myxococcales bacterium]|nr:hypothetical protein [Myxococcales bacterium]
MVGRRKGGEAAVGAPVEACDGGPDEAIGEAPAEVADLAAACVRAVHRALGVELDYDPDSIPLLDHYLTLLPDRPRAPTREPVRGLVAAMTGAYFGEVVRRLFPARWTLEPGREALDWRLEFRYCFLAFSPVAVAWEVLLRRDALEGAAAYFLEEPTRGQVAERLDRLPRVTIDDYYTFAQRLETLVLTVGWLSERVQQSGRSPRPIEPRRYAEFFRKLRTPG